MKSYVPALMNQLDIGAHCKLGEVALDFTYKQPSHVEKTSSPANTSGDARRFCSGAIRLPHRRQPDNGPLRVAQIAPLIESVPHKL